MMTSVWLISGPEWFENVSLIAACFASIIDILTELEHVMFNPHVLKWQTIRF